MRSLRTVSELTEELRVLPTGMRIIAIDGRCAAGKTTLAARLAKELGGDVIHMDDFFLPLELRTEERFGRRSAEASPAEMCTMNDF